MSFLQMAYSRNQNFLLLHLQKYMPEQVIFRLYLTGIEINEALFAFDQSLLGA